MGTMSPGTGLRQQDQLTLDGLEVPNLVGNVTDLRLGPLEHLGAGRLGVVAQVQQFLRVAQ